MAKSLDELKGTLDALLLLAKKASGEKIKIVKSNNTENNGLKLPDIFKDEDFEEADSETEQELATLNSPDDDNGSEHSWSEDSLKDKRIEKLKDLESSDSLNDFEKQLRKQKEAKEKARQQQLELKQQIDIKKGWFSDATPLSKLDGGKAYTDLISTFRRALSQQTGESEDEEETFHRLNPNYYKGIYRLPGVENVEKATKPKIQLYIDLSGSLDYSDFDKAKSLISQLELFRRQQVLEYDVYFFADDISKIPNYRKLGGGTNAYIEILTNITKTKPTNVIIFTDDDFDNYAKRDSSKSKFENLFNVTVPGFVWWIFCGNELKEVYKFLTGKKKTYRFKIR